MALEDLEVFRVLEVEQFMHSLESRNLQESTRYSYGRDLESFRSWLDGRGEEIMAGGPAVVLGRVVNHDRRVGKPGVLRSGLGREAHAMGDMFDAGGNVGLDRCKDVAVANPDSEGSASSHRVSAEIDAVLVDGVFFDHPFDRVDGTFFNRGGIASRVHFFQAGVSSVHTAPPPVAAVGPAVEVEGVEVIG